MLNYFHIAQILVSTLLISVILLQVRSMTGAGIFWASASVFRTRRGVEKTLFQLTIALAILFVIISLLAVRLR